MVDFRLTLIKHLIQLVTVKLLVMLTNIRLTHCSRIEITFLQLIAYRKKNKKINACAQLGQANLIKHVFQQNERRCQKVLFDGDIVAQLLPRLVTFANEKSPVFTCTVIPRSVVNTKRLRAVLSSSVS